MGDANYHAENRRWWNRTAEEPDEPPFFSSAETTLDMPQEQCNASDNNVNYLHRDFSAFYVTYILGPRNGQRLTSLGMASGRTAAQ
jgi:hypothetical protein